MDPIKHLAEYRPELRLIVDEMPPLGTKVWLVTRYGHGFAGPFHPEYEVVAWAPLPKFTVEQKRRLRAMDAAFVDPTKHVGEIDDDKYGRPGTDEGYQCCPKGIS